MQRSVLAEFMDDEATGTIADLRDNLRDLARINAWFGGTHSILREIEARPVMPRTILDVGCGGADVPLSILKHLAARGMWARCVALDRSARVLSCAAAAVRGSEAISTVQGDATALQFEDGRFDLVTCSLALHHLGPADAVQALREMARVGAHVIVSDLRRSRAAWLAARALLPLITRNRFTLHDGPISVRRAYTPGEVRSMAERAGWTRIEVRAAFGARLLLTGGR
jgi:ubiquinone/menaquinone biosynthesis C-methylase UbiE